MRIYNNNIFEVFSPHIIFAIIIYRMAAVAANRSLDIAAKPNIINCWFVVDNSASMSGAKIDLAANGVLNCIGQLTNSDFFGILTFANDIEVVTAGPKETTSISKFYSVKADGGGTALYDAILKAGLMSYGLHKQIKSSTLANNSLNVITYMILLTDGEDNASKSTRNDVKAFLTEINKTRDFKIILAGVGLSYSATSIMREFGAIGDSDIQFRELKSNDDIKELFEHFTIIIRETRQAAVVTAQGAVMMQQTREIDLTSGAISSGTSLFGLGINSGNRNNTPTKRINDSGNTVHLLDNRVKEVPSTLEHFWDDSYDLNDYELKALYGFEPINYRVLMLVVLMFCVYFFLYRVRCCQCCCCQCCCLPGTIDHCCAMLPSSTIGACITEGTCVPIICAPCIAIPLLLCCPCFHIKMCSISHAITNEGYNRRYEG